MLSTQQRWLYLCGSQGIEPEHAQRVADLTLYVRQHHAERDQAALGRLVLDAGAPW